MIFKLGSLVKSKTVVGAILQVTLEPGTPNDFGIFDRNEGNPTAAYTEQTREGYRKWKGKYEETITWDRDTYAPPPDILECIHVSVVDPASQAHRHGWIFVNQLETVNTSRATATADTTPTAKDEQAVMEVNTRRLKVARMKRDLAADEKKWQAKVDSVGDEIAELRRRLAALEQKHSEAESEMWRLRNERGLAINHEQEMIDDIIFQNHHIAFPEVQPDASEGERSVFNFSSLLRSFIYE